MKKTDSIKAHSIALFSLAALFLVSWLKNLEGNLFAVPTGAPPAWYVVGAFLPLAVGIVALVGGMLIRRNKSISPVTKAALWFSLLIGYFMVLSLPGKFSLDFISNHTSVYTAITIACYVAVPLLVSYFLGAVSGLSFAVFRVIIMVLNYAADAIRYSDILSSTNSTINIILTTTSQFLLIAITVIVPFKIGLSPVLAVVCGVSDAVLISSVLNMIAIQFVDPGVNTGAFLEMIPFIICSASIHAVDISRKAKKGEDAVEV